MALQPRGEARAEVLHGREHMLGKAESSLLLDYYGSFLTERQAELMRMSADEDMSLSEIAEQVGVSRQAVRDHLSKAAKELELLEERLGLVARDRALLSVCQGLETAANGEGDAKEEAERAASIIRSLIR